MKKKNKKSREGKFKSRIAAIVVVITFCAFYATSIICKTHISSMQMTIEKLDYKISVQEKKNESLTMQVSELTSYENVSNVIEDMGLAYNNKNIVVINK